MRQAVIAERERRSEREGERRNSGVQAYIFIDTCIIFTHRICIIAFMHALRVYCVCVEQIQRLLYPFNFVLCTVYVHMLRGMQIQTGRTHCIYKTSTCFCIHRIPVTCAILSLYILFKDIVGPVIMCTF